MIQVFTLSLNGGLRYSIFMSPSSAAQKKRDGAHTLGLIHQARGKLLLAAAAGNVETRRAHRSKSSALLLHKPHRRKSPTASGEGKKKHHSGPEYAHTHSRLHILQKQTKPVIFASENYSQKLRHFLIYSLSDDYLNNNLH